MEIHLQGFSFKNDKNILQIQLAKWSV